MQELQINPANESSLRGTFILFYTFALESFTLQCFKVLKPTRLIGLSRFKALKSIFALHFPANFCQSKILDLKCSNIN